MPRCGSGGCCQTTGTCCRTHDCICHLCTGCNFQCPNCHCHLGPCFTLDPCDLLLLAFFAPIFWVFVGVFFIMGAFAAFFAVATAQSGECASIGRTWLILGIVNVGCAVAFAIYFSWRVMQRGFRAYANWVHQDAIAMLALWFCVWMLAWTAVAGWLHFSGEGGTGSCRHNLGVGFWITVAFIVASLIASVCVSLWYRHELEGYEYERRRTAQPPVAEPHHDLDAYGHAAHHHHHQPDNQFHPVHMGAPVANAPPAKNPAFQQQATGVAPAPTNPHFYANGASAPARAAPMGEPVSSARPADVMTPRAAAATSPAEPAPVNDQNATTKEASSGSGGNVVMRGATAVVSGIGSLFGRRGQQQGQPASPA